MDIQKGDRVMVNLAPLIGSARPSRQSVPCEVLAIDGPKLQVITESPYRQVTLWVLAAWIDERSGEEASPTRSPEVARKREPSLVS